VLLLITGSIDATSNLLIRSLGTEQVFRFNFDLYKDYELVFSPDYWSIKNPAGHCIDSNSVTKVFWWKAFNYHLVDEDEFITEEVKYIFREIYHWGRLRKITKGNPHDFHNHLGKLNILDIGKKYFQTPLTLATFRPAGVEKLKDKKIVAKSFSSGLTTTNKALMTTEVHHEKLHPNFPWYLQERINSKSDITTFICGNDYFTFERNRDNLKGLDWRMEQSFDKYVKEWYPFKLSAHQNNLISQFCNEIKVDWGRIDFMLSESNELIFLEFNANGQWVFLDFKNEYGLLDSVTQYLTN